MNNIKLPSDIVPLLNWKIDFNNTNANGIVLTNEKEEIAVICPGYYNNGNVLRNYRKHVVTQKEMEEFVKLYMLQTNFNNDLDSILNGKD